MTTCSAGWALISPTQMEMQNEIVDNKHDYSFLDTSVRDTGEVTTDQGIAEILEINIENLP